MNFLIGILILFFNLVIGASYLSNTNLEYNISQMEIDLWFDLPLSGYHNSYPPTGINCATGYEDESIVYLISSQSLLNRHGDYERCFLQKRTVSIFKRDLNLSKTIDHLVIGPTYSTTNQYKCYRWNDYEMEIIEQLSGLARHSKEVELCTSKGFYWRNHMNPIPNDCQCGCCQKIIFPVGGKGSDHVTSCGIDKNTNILYYIGGNYHSCSDNFHTEPSIVRINLTSFSFIDRTKLKEIEGFSGKANWTLPSIDNEKKFFNFPGKSEIINGKIYLSFYNDNTGIWEIDLRSFPIKITNSFQKKIEERSVIQNGNLTETLVSYHNIKKLTKSVYDSINNCIYFISESNDENAKVLKINLTKSNYFNNSVLIELNGINNIKDIKIDNFHRNIYLLVGQLTSEIFKLDMNFNILPVSPECGIDSLVLPSEYQAAQNMVIDSLSGFIYAFFLKEPYNGFVIIKIKDLELIDEFYQFRFKRNGQIWTPNYLNTTYLNRKTGKLFVSNVAEETNFFTTISEIKLLGCSPGRRVGNFKCETCIPGTFTDKIGLSFCKLCNYGYSATSTESKSCLLCEKGKYASLMGSIDCYSCQPGNYSEYEGSKYCSKCEPGKYSLKAESDTPTNCIDCDFGKYSLAGSDVCLNCELGEYVNNRRSCFPCPKGRFSNDLEITSFQDCILCPKGKYNNLTGSDSISDCIECPEGKYGNILGSNSISGCLNCPSGRFRNDLMNPGVECAICPNGKVSQIGEIECSNCETGKYRNQELNCQECIPGKYNSLEGGNSLDNCLDCPKGKYNSKYGSTDITNCKDCEIGKYNDLLGSKLETDCKLCPVGKVRDSEGGTSINDCDFCQPGKYSTNSYKCMDCQKGKFINKQGADECNFCENNKYTDYNGSIMCLDCVENSEPNLQKTKCECIVGTYRTNEDPLVCSLCPDNFICNKGATIKTLILKNRFWRANKTTLVTEECRKGYNCVGGQIKNNSNDLCNEGHTGPLCDVCLDGWAKNEGKCFKCLTDDLVKARSYIFTFLFPVLISVIIFFMIKTANPSSSTGQKEPLSGVIKIFMNYAQIFTLASSFEINWPDIVLNLFDRTKEFSSPKISFYSSDCTLGWEYYDKLLTYILLPILYVVIVTIILSVYSFVFYKRKRDSIIINRDISSDEKRKYLKNNPEPLIFYQAWICTSILIGLFLAWPTIIKQSLSIIPCKEFGNRYYLLQDLSIECYTGKYYIYLILSYISLAVYGFIVPFIAFNLIRAKRFSLYDFETKYEMPAPLSFLFLGYREEVWYYEFIVMAKKYSLIAITVFLKEYSRYQMISASLFIQAAFFIHVFIRPYDTITNYGILCNKLESISLLALVVTLNSGLFFGTINDQYNLGNFEIVLIIILFLMNILVMIYFLYYLVKLSFNESIEIFKKLYSKLYQNNSFLIRCFSKEKKDNIYNWSQEKEIETHGIDLKSSEEIELFEHFFNDKKMFSHELKTLLRNEELNKLGLILKRIRSKIEIIEKQRCWMSILNNRLYKKLQHELLDNKDKINKDNIDKLNDILENYIDNGLKYGKIINNISVKALQSIKRKSIVEMKTIVNYESSSDSDTSIDESDFKSSNNVLETITI